RVPVYAINEHSALVRHSRYCRGLEPGADPDSWARFLLGPQSEHLHGAVLLACSDDAIELIAHHRPALAQKFLPDHSHPTAPLCMLSRCRTYRAAQAAGVATPRFWVASPRNDVLALTRRQSLVFPLIVKPHLTHVLERRAGRKFILVHNTSQLL